MRNLQITSLAILALCSGLANADCDIEKGAKVFKRCASCHSTEKDIHKMGPSLYGIIDRKIGGTQGFNYSVAMDQHKLNWDKDNLSEFIKSPMTYIVGTTMPFRGLKKDADRNAIVCYLDTFK